MRDNIQPLHRRFDKARHFFCNALLALAVLIICSTLFPLTSFAQCPYCAVISDAHIETRQVVRDEHGDDGSRSSGTVTRTRIESGDERTETEPPESSDAIPEGAAIAHSRSGPAALDLDGSPTAYGPTGGCAKTNSNTRGTGDDFLGNAGTGYECREDSSNNWFGIVTDKCGTGSWRRGKPLLNSNGMYISQTSWQNKCGGPKASVNCRRQENNVNSNTVPFVAKCNADKGVQMGQIVRITDENTGQSICAVVADHAASRCGPAEISAAAADQLGIRSGTHGIVGHKLRLDFLDPSEVPLATMAPCQQPVLPADCEVSGAPPTEYEIEVEYETVEPGTRGYVTDQFEMHRWMFFVEYFFHHHIKVSMQRMTDQLSAAAFQNTMSIGAMIDAGIQLDTQRMLQTMTASTHKDYHPSLGLCSIGSTTYGLAKNYQTIDFTNQVLGERSRSRQLLNENSISSTGAAMDLQTRTEDYRKRYCDQQDNNEGLDLMCPTVNDGKNLNRDIDFTRSLYNPVTLDLDFSDDKDTDDEHNIFTLANNLYGHRLYNKVAKADWKNSLDQQYLLDMRALVAKRNVAEHSFYTLVGMKTKGSAARPKDEQYASAILQGLGLTGEEASYYIGESPSYFALMELLTKKIYQDPDFYTNLYDKPANVGRKGAALRAISTMQNMDRFKSELRNEMLLSVLTEMRLLESQDSAQINLGKMDTKGVSEKED